MKYTHCLLALASTAMALGQISAQTISLKPSTSALPISAQGQVTCSISPNRGVSFMGVVTLKNTSGKNILTYMATVTAVCPGSVTDKTVDVHDFYFKHQVFEVGDTQNIELNHMELGGTATGLADAYFKLDLRFIEYEDGTSWGDQTAVTELATRRRATEAFLGELTTDSDADFLTHITDSSLHGKPEWATAKALKMIYDQSGMASARQSAIDRLNTAKSRTRTLIKSVADNPIFPNVVR
jgi:hypothetical protein